MKKKVVIQLNAERNGSKFQQLFDSSSEAKKKYDELKENDFIVQWTVHEGLTVDEFIQRTYKWGAL